MRTKKEVEAVGKRMKEINDLLAEFGLRLAGFQPGVSARDKDSLYYDFNGRVWAWLEPLLVELREYRKKGH